MNNVCPPSLTDGFINNSIYSFLLNQGHMIENKLKCMIIINSNYITKCPHIPQCPFDQMCFVNYLLLG